MDAGFKVQTLAVEEGRWIDWEKPTAELPQGAVVRFLENPAETGEPPDWTLAHDQMGHTVRMILKVWPASEELQDHVRDFVPAGTLCVSLPDVPTAADFAALRDRAGEMLKEFEERWRHSDGTPNWRIQWRGSNPKITVVHTFLTLWTEWDRVTP